MSCFIALDPGKEGGFAIFDDGKVVLSEPMPLVSGEINIRYLGHLARNYRVKSAVIEKVGAAPTQGRQQGGKSMFTFGTGYGMLLGLFEGLGLPYHLVAPQTWKAKVLPRTKKDKDAAVAFVHRSHPEVDLTPGRKVKPHDGIADAVCIGEFGRLELLL